MKKLLLLAYLATVAVAFEIDWSKVHPMNAIPDALKLQPMRQSAQLDRQHGRITGGEEAPRNSIPHQVGLFLQLGDSTGFCGGSLISDRWVLTAAHCVEGVSSALVCLGAHYIREQEDRVEMVSSDFIIHEGWDRAKLSNDLALIKLPQPVQFSDKIQPINLPRRTDASNKFEGVPAIASGWGKDSDSAASISPVLRYVKTEIFHWASCRVLFMWVPTESNICSNGSEGRSTCNGDSGGPLVLHEADGTPFLIGATSFGSGAGCEKNLPAVFTRTAAYLDWINAKTGIPLR